MKIVFIGQKGIPVKAGGVEKHVNDLAVKLVEKGHDVSVYTRPSYTDSSLKEYRGVKLISIPSIPTKHLDAISHTFFACLDIIFRRDFDIIHFHSIGPSSLIWFVKIFKPHTPVVATFHTQCYHHKKWGIFARFFLKMSERICCYFSDRVITISTSLNRYAKEKYGIDATYSPNGVNPMKKVAADEISERWGLTKDSYIVSVGRLIQHKGIHYIIEAYKQLKTDKKLVIVGDGFFTDKYVQQLEEMARGNENIIFTGTQSGRVLKELFSNAYMFIQPSESEGLSIALLEAMSYATPVLVSDIEENREAVDDAGFYFKNKNIADLRFKMDEMLVKPTEIQAKAQMALERVEKHYSWNSIVVDVLEVYEDALLERHRETAYNQTLFK
jgi:glycosyltransferase involved in cell wall biosynthesis